MKKWLVVIPALAVLSAHAEDRVYDIGIDARSTTLPEDIYMAEKFKQVADEFWVSPQISASDIKDAAAMGVTLIINNRPDGEMMGQPKSAEIEAAAKAAGIAYAHIPVDRGGVTPNHTAAFEQAVDDAEDGPTLAFCRTGMRSAMVFAYAEARFGKPVDLIISEAAAAGFDIAGHEPALVLLYEAHKAPRTDPPV